MMGVLQQMKMIAIIDVPDGEGKWYIDGEIHYTENESLMKKFDADMIPLKPMPQEQDIYEIGMDEEDTNAKRQWNKGWNACLEEIVGETE